MSDNSEELTKYFEDILKNKELIIEMINTNLLMYEDKIKTNKDKISQIKETHEKINGEFLNNENKLKLEYSKYHDQYQKHDINYKLLDRTSSHYKTLIKEREDEIRKFEEQSIYCYQDYQNKKCKLDCLNVQIVEAEFQFKNLQKLMDDKINNLCNNNSKKEFQILSLDGANLVDRIETRNGKVGEGLDRNVELLSVEEESKEVEMKKSVSLRKRMKNIFGEEVSEKEEKLLSRSNCDGGQNEIINVKDKRNCVIF